MKKKLILIASLSILAMNVAYSQESHPLAGEDSTPTTTSKPTTTETAQKHQLNQGSVSVASQTIPMVVPGTHNRHTDKHALENSGLPSLVSHSHDKATPSDKPASVAAEHSKRHSSDPAKVHHSHDKATPSDNPASAAVEHSRRHGSGSERWHNSIEHKMNKLTDICELLEKNNQLLSQLLESINKLHTSQPPASASSAASAAPAASRSPALWGSSSYDSPTLRHLALSPDPTPFADPFFTSLNPIVDQQQTQQSQASIWGQPAGPKPTQQDAGNPFGTGTNSTQQQ